jgi:hypothetical protein
MSTWSGLPSTASESPRWTTASSAGFRLKTLKLSAAATPSA